MTSNIGIPIKLLNEAQVSLTPADESQLHASVANHNVAQGHIVTLEITSGQTYRGKLLEGTFLQLAVIILQELWPANNPSSRG